MTPSLMTLTGLLLKRLSALCRNQSSYPCLIIVTITTNASGAIDVTGDTGLLVTLCTVKGQITHSLFIHFTI